MAAFLIIAIQQMQARFARLAPGPARTGPVTASLALALVAQGSGAVA